MRRLPTGFWRQVSQSMTAMMQEASWYGEPLTSTVNLNLWSSEEIPSMAVFLGVTHVFFSIPDGMLVFRDFKTILHATIHQVKNLLHIS